MAGWASSKRRERRSIIAIRASRRSMKAATAFRPLISSPESLPDPMGPRFCWTRSPTLGGQATATQEPLFGNLGSLVGETVGRLRVATSYLCGKAGAEVRLASATPYLRLFGITARAAYLAKSAFAAQRMLARGVEDPMLHDAIAVWRFLSRILLPQAPDCHASCWRGPVACCLSDFIA